MKKLLFAFAAGLLLLAGCAKEYDDTALKEKVQAIDKKVDALQAEVDKLKGDVTALQTIINEWKSGGLITKIEDAKEGGVVVGKTITFLGGKTVTLFNGKDGKDGQDGSSPVIGVKEDAGVLYWTVNGEYLISGGKKVPVNVVPSFEIKEGHLWVTINGVAQDLGLIATGAPVDSLIKSIVETETTVVITLNTVPEKVIEIPLAKPFGFVFESTDFAVLNADPINIPYTLNGKTDKTTVGVFTNANYTAEIDAEKVVVTPPAAGVKGEVLVWAANHEGQSDIAKLTFGPVQSEKTDPAPEDPEGKYEDDVDYIAEAVSGAVEAHVTANVDIAVKSEAEWITVGEITKAAYTINLTLQDNPNDIIRYGNVKVVLKSNEEVVLQTFKIAQAAGESVPTVFDPDNFAALDWSNKQSATWYKFAQNYALPDGFTFIIHIYPYTLNTSGMRVGNFGKQDESPCNMLRFGQNGNNAELEWMVDHGTGRSQKELLAPGFKVNKWQAVVLTADKATGEYKIYRNDELKASKTFTYNDAMGFGAIEFANSWGSSWRSAFNGRMALISVYDKALSADEIKDNIFAVPVSENCVGFWPMIEGEGGLLKADQSRAIKEDIDLTKTTRTDNESDYIIVDVTPYVTWTTGNQIIPELPPVPDPDTWKVDVLNNAFTGVNNTSTSYQSWSNKPGSASEAVYAGMSARGYNASELSIQLRSSNSNSGVISTTSGGKVKKIEVTFTPRTTNRIVSVYGKNEPYAAPTELYNASSQGTLLGEIQAGTGEYTLYVDGDYEYVGFRSKDGSIYLEEVKISWEPIPQLPDNLQEGLAPDFKQMMFNVTFPDELNHTDEVTFEGWIYAKSFSGAQANLPTFMGVENSILVRFNQNGVPEYLLGDQMTGGGEVKATNSSFRLSTNQWYHVAATYKRNDKMYLYVNAEEVASNNTKDYPVELNTGVSGNDDSVIGRKFYVGNAFSTRWFTGNMSHIRIWKKALTAEEIKASANNKLLMTDPDLIANWPLTDKEGIAVTDLSGNELSTKFVTYSTASGVADAENVVREDVNVPDLIFAESLQLNKTALDLMRGDQETLIVSVVPSNALVPSISWESSDATIASVAGGLVTAKGVGEAVITAKATVNGSEIKAECAVTVTGLTGAVAPYMKENYFRTMGGYGSLNEVTVEWKMKGKNFDAPTVSSVFGREGQWLLRIGDEGIEKNELQLATNHGNWTTGVKFDTDKWYHVAVTYSTETQNAQIYVNGAMVAENPGFATAAANLTGTTSTTISWNSNPYSSDVNIGASYFDRTGSWNNYKAVNNRWFDGQMCEVRVWSVVRSADEISANMDNLADTSSENLKAYYKMDLTDANNGDGRTIKDYSTAAKDLTCGAAEAIWQQGREDIGNN